MSRPLLTWVGIVRLGLVQTALGAIVVLTTSTLNRVMVVELALPAMLPGALVAWHYAIQILRPRLGYGADVGGRPRVWIIGGMAVLASGGVLAAWATVLMPASTSLGTALAVLAFSMIGLGVGASGTTVLATLARQVEARRRAAAATTVWVMMIMGFVITAATAGHFLDPFSPQRLLVVTSVVSALAFTVTLLALFRIQWNHYLPATPAPEHDDTAPAQKLPFREALQEVWAEPRARLFTIFVFVSMLAYSAQDLVLEPFAGAVFAYTPGQSTQLAGVQHGGVLFGMLLVAIACSAIGRGRLGDLKTWTVGGCLASAIVLVTLAASGFSDNRWPLSGIVFCLGLANGAFAVAAIGSMMGLASSGRARREGTRMGMFGAAQAIAFGLGGFAGTAIVDVARWLAAGPATAYALVFLTQAALFAVSALLAARVNHSPRTRTEVQSASPMDIIAASAGRG